ncbi:MAG: hypothetical protein RL748_2488 [Pseudomonadota bacterium]|jgi:hypothetical protein
MQKVLWDQDGSPRGHTLAAVLYQIRAHDGNQGLLLDAVSRAEILLDADSVLLMDALVLPYAELERRMAVVQKAMNKAGGAVSVVAMQITEPFKQKGTTNVAVIFELSDGQTISVFFHNPDTTPQKIEPKDDLISWRWLLNKKDITIVVAPEKGIDINIRVVAARIMQLASANSPRFTQANARRAATMEEIASLTEELTTKQAQLTQLTQQIDEAKVTLETTEPILPAKPKASKGKAAKTPEPAPAKNNADKVAEPAAAPENPAQENPARQAAMNYLEATIKGSNDFADPALTVELRKIHADFKDDPAIMELFKQAANVFSRFAVERAQAVLKARA